jgi:hypothetical protein
MTYQQKQHLMMLISLKMDESDDDSTNLPIAMIDSEINHSYGWESAHNCTSSKPHFGNKQKNALERMNLQQLHIVINNLTIATTTIYAMSRIHYQSD